MSYFKNEQDYFDCIDSGKPEKNHCIYCDAEDSDENPVVERKYSILGKHLTEHICKSCLSEELSYENEKIVEHVHS